MIWEYTSYDRHIYSIRYMYMYIQYYHLHVLYM